MEWISHISAGVIVGKVSDSDTYSTKIHGWFLALVALSPDLLSPLFLGITDTHRGVTHSLYFWPILACLWAIAAKTFLNRPRQYLFRDWLTCFAVIGSHLLLDILTAYPFYPGLPFTSANWSMGWMPMFDLYLILTWLLLLILRALRNWSRSKFLRACMIAMFAIIAMRGVGKLGAVPYALECPEDRRIVVSSIPDYFRPWIWWVRADRCENIWISVNILTGKHNENDIRKNPRSIGLGLGGM